MARQKGRGEGTEGEEKTYRRFAIVERVRIRKRSLHRPSPQLVLAPNEALHLAAVRQGERGQFQCGGGGNDEERHVLVRRNVTLLQVSLPVEVRTLVTPSLNRSDLLRRPGVEINGFDWGRNEKKRQSSGSISTGELRDDREGTRNGTTRRTPRDVNSHSSMNSGTPDAHEAPEVRRRPSRVYLPS